MRFHYSLNSNTTYNDMLAATQIYSRLDLLKFFVENVQLLIPAPLLWLYGLVSETE